MKNDEAKNEIIIYAGGNGQSSIEVRMQGETVWLTQKQLCFPPLKEKKRQGLLWRQ